MASSLPLAVGCLGLLERGALIRNARGKENLVCVTPGHRGNETVSTGVDVEIRIERRSGETEGRESVAGYTSAKLTASYIVHFVDNTVLCSNGGLHRGRAPF